MKYPKYLILVFVFFLFSSGAYSQTGTEKTFLESAVKLLNEGDFKGAIKQSSEAIEKNRDSFFGYLIRGNSYLEIKDYDNAKSDAEAAMRLKPASQDSWALRGSIYIETENYELALSDYNQAIKLAPNDEGNFINRGLVHHRLGNQSQAMADSDEAIRLAPGNATARSNRGDGYYTDGNYNKAIEDFHQAITLDPEYGYAYINLFTAYCRKLQFQKALQYYKEYQSKKLTSFLEDGSEFYRWYVMAVQEVASSSYNTALDHLNTALKEYKPGARNVDNEYIATLALQGFVLEQLGRTTEAKDVYHKALVININQPDLKDALARLEKKQTIAVTQDNTAPVIEILSPKGSRGLAVVSAGLAIQVIGRAKDPSGIASLRVNGKVIKAEEDGLFVAEIQLHNGANTVSVVATDNHGNASSHSFDISGAKETKIAAEEEIVAPVSSRPKFHAILIAEQDYRDPNIADLENPIKDASELKSILEQYYTFNSENITTLFDKSREEIMQAIVERSSSLGTDDNLLIFYAGHGIAEKDKFGDVDGYWVPSSATKGLNASYISSDDINKALKRSNSQHILVVADACFSGAFTRSLSSDASVGIQKQFAVPSRKIMASGNLEPVPDNSKFIYFLKKNLKENNQKYLTAKKLFDSFYEAILNNSETSPQYSAIKNVGDEGGEFVFIKK